VFVRSAYLHRAPVGSVEFAIFTDAAKDGTGTPGIGDFFLPRTSLPSTVAFFDVVGKFEIQSQCSNSWALPRQS
jgi:hypothetical protein